MVRHHAQSLLPLGDAAGDLDPLLATWSAQLWNDVILRPRVSVDIELRS
jgi:hypothetical protein